MADRTAAAPTARPREAARAVFRRAILDAAEAVFAERGFHDARIQDVAERAQIAVGTVYNHFAQKEDVLLALFDERMTALHAAIFADPCSGTSFEARLRERLTRMLRFVDGHRRFFALASEHGLVSPTRPSSTDAICGDAHPFERMDAELRALVDDGLAEGAIRGDERCLARFLGGIIRALVLGAVEDGHARIEDEAPRIAGLFLHGAVGAPDAPQSRERSPRRKRATG
jgi:AcrR family transcriptional regulator